MKQTTLHISFTKNDEDLHHDIIRFSALNYCSTAHQARVWLRKGREADAIEKNQQHLLSK